MVMKREYVLALFLVGLGVLIFSSDFIFGEEKTTNFLNNYIVIWLMFVFYLGQFSMRFPKAF